MALNLSQLLKTITRQSVVDLILQELASLGFNTTRFQEGRAQRNHIESFAELVAVVTEVIPALARGGLLGLAAGLWLDFLGQKFFGLTRAEATNAEHTIELTSSGVPHSWAVGAMVVATVEGVSFEAVDAGAIAATETISITVRAILPGSIGSVGVSKIVDLVTPFAGVTVTNPAIPSVGNSMTVVGVDVETDARYTRRCELRFASLTYSGPRNAYELWALEADPTITRVTITNPVGDGTVIVTLATAVGGVTAAQIATVLAYINDGRRPINDVPTVQSAVVVTIAIPAAPTVRKGEYATVTAATNALEDAYDNFFAALPIGGRIIAPAVTGEIVRDELIEVAMVLAGFRRANIATPASDTGLSANEIAIGQYFLLVAEESS